MSSFLKYLEKKSKSSSVVIKGKKAIWFEEDTEPKMPSEFLDLYYGGATGGDYVVMSRSMAKELEERLKRLEEENKKLKERNDILKAVILGLAIIMITLMLWRGGL